MQEVAVEIFFKFRTIIPGATDIKKSQQKTFKNESETKKNDHLFHENVV